MILYSCSQMLKTHFTHIVANSLDFPRIVFSIPPAQKFRLWWKSDFAIILKIHETSHFYFHIVDFLLLCPRDPWPFWLKQLRLEIVAACFSTCQCSPASDAEVSRIAMKCLLLAALFGIAHGGLVRVPIQKTVSLKDLDRIPRQNGKYKDLQQNHQKTISGRTIPTL